MKSILIAIFIILFSSTTFAQNGITRIESERDLAVQWISEEIHQDGWIIKVEAACYIGQEALMVMYRPSTPMSFNDQSTILIEVDNTPPIRMRNSTDVNDRRWFSCVFLLGAPTSDLNPNDARLTTEIISKESNNLTKISLGINAITLYDMYGQKSLKFTDETSESLTKYIDEIRELVEDCYD